MKVSNLELKYMALATQWKINVALAIIVMLLMKVTFYYILFFMIFLICWFIECRYSYKAEKESKRLNS